MEGIFTINEVSCNVFLMSYTSGLFVWSCFLCLPYTLRFIICLCFHLVAQTSYDGTSNIASWIYFIFSVFLTSCIYDVCLALLMLCSETFSSYVTYVALYQYHSCFSIFVLDNSLGYLIDLPFSSISFEKLITGILSSYLLVPQ